MAEKIPAQLDQEQVNGLEAMQEAGEADSYSEAVRVSCGVGLRELGYTNGERQSGIAAASRAVGWLAGIVGIVWLGVTIAYPVETRLPALAAMLASLAAFGVGRLVTGGWRHRLGRLFGRSA